MIYKDRLNESTISYSKLAEAGITEDVFRRLYRIPRELGYMMKTVFGDQIKWYLHQVSVQSNANNQH